MPVGAFVFSNLAQSLVGSEIFRAIRSGVDHQGRWLIIISYTNAGKLSDHDIRAFITCLRHLSPAGQQTPNPDVAFLPTPVTVAIRFLRIEIAP